MNKKFKIEEVLSAVKGVLLCDISKVYNVYNFLLNDNLYTHQLPRAGRFIQPILEKQIPLLAEIDLTDITTENWKERLDIIKQEYPNEIELTPIPAGWQYKNPIDEAEEMIGKENVIIATI